MAIKITIITPAADEINTKIGTIFGKLFGFLRTSGTSAEISVNKGVGMAEGEGLFVEAGVGVGVTVDMDERIIVGSGVAVGL